MCVSFQTYRLLAKDTTEVSMFFEWSLYVVGYYFLFLFGFSLHSLYCLSFFVVSSDELCMHVTDNQLFYLYTKLPYGKLLVYVLWHCFFFFSIHFVTFHSTNKTPLCECRFPQYRIWLVVWWACSTVEYSSSLVDKLWSYRKFAIVLPFSGNNNNNNDENRVQRVQLAKAPMASSQLNSAMTSAIFSSLSYFLLFFAHNSRPLFLCAWETK